MDPRLTSKERAAACWMVGSATVDIAGSVFVKGSFELAAGQVKSADLPSGGSQEADALALTFTNVDVFVGVDGSLSDNKTPDDHSDDTIENGTLGFRATVGGLTVVSIKDLGADRGAGSMTSTVI